MTTLAEFFKVAEQPERVNFRAWIKVRGFNSLYLRYGQRAVNGKIYSPVLDIGSVEATVTGKGTFKKLIARIQHMRPGLHIFVESVLSKRFERGLTKMGFDLVKGSHELAPNYFLPSAKTVLTVMSDGALTGHIQVLAQDVKNRAQRKAVRKRDSGRNRRSNAA